MINGCVHLELLSALNDVSVDHRTAKFVEWYCDLFLVTALLGTR